MKLFGIRAGTAGLAAAVAALTLLLVPALAGADVKRPTPNFVAFLREPGGGPLDGFGLLVFRQPADADVIAFLDVYVARLARNHDYFLQRAVDPLVDGNCTGTNWLTLGHGPVPAAVTTDGKGTGRAFLWRELSGVLGQELDIHFRLIDAHTSGVVLESGCKQFKVVR